jgi:hypothetical protein
MKFSDIKSFTYIGNSVTIDEVYFIIPTPLAVEFDAVQYHKDRPILEEPLMVVAAESKYQYALDEWVEAKRVSEIVVAPTLVQAREFKNSEILNAFDDAVKAIVDAQPHEMVSWGKQETEARAYMSDNASATPMIDAILTTRNLGETKLELVNKIIGYSDAYQVAYGTLLGAWQNKQKQVELALTVDEVNLIGW